MNEEEYEDGAPLNFNYRASFRKYRWCAAVVAVTCLIAWSLLFAAAYAWLHDQPFIHLGLGAFCAGAVALIFGIKAGNHREYALLQLQWASQEKEPWQD